MKTELRLRYTTLFKRQRKALAKRGYDMQLLDAVIRLLASGDPLPERYHDHALSGRLKGRRDCHILPDWILIYEKHMDMLTLLLCETGSHSDLYGN